MNGILAYLLMTFFLIIHLKMSEDEDRNVRTFVHGLVGKYPRKLDLFHEAFCHRSVNEKNSYERLECLGDAVLGMIACEYYVDC